MKGPRLGRAVRAGALTGGLLAVVAAAFSSCRPGVPDRAADRPQAVVLFVGDGFGVAHLSVARLPLVGKGGRLALEGLPVLGLVTTYSASNAVTDSAAAATAFASGAKTRNHFLGIDPEERPLASLAHRARREGWLVGLVTTTRITHATPAAFYAHTTDRYGEDEIALQLLEAPVNLALGGGEALFRGISQGGSRRDERDLVAEARQRGWTVTLRGEPLPGTGKFPQLALLASSHLGFRIDEARRPEAEQDPSLEQLTRYALEVLEASGKPFFLMVEGGRIDHAGHGFDVAGLVHEIADFDRAVELGHRFQQRASGTLLLVTSDHATGGLALNDFARFDDIGRRTASVSWLVSQLRHANADPAILREHTGYSDFSAAEIEAIRTAIDDYEASRRLGTLLSQRDGFTWVPRVDPAETQGHTGEDVLLFAGGTGAERFRGLLDQTEIPARLCEVLRWDPPCP